MPTTTRFSLPYPAGSDVPDVPQDMQDLADGVDAVVLGWSADTFSNRPSAGTSGRAFYATDTGALYYDNGSAWVQILRAGGTLSDFIDLNRNQLRKPVLVDYTEKIETVAAAGASRQLNLATANVWDVTLSATCVFTFGGMRSGEASTLTLILRNDATGRTPIWSAAVEWPDATVPDFSAANSVHLISFLSVDGGTTVYGVPGGMDFG